ncbi:hypothetical protein AYI70_g8519 [Smittium culicis]|uniref:Uncharacterized protein n=1 Tax=Smittium culicis TaxID=133412 RepID=A0A1R1XFN2_9FUNG|nr:hypothetical protein AYI70_g8519 [Smittium culicis]
MADSWPSENIRLFTSRLAQKRFSSANKEASVFLKVIYLLLIPPPLSLSISPHSYFFNNFSSPLSNRSDPLSVDFFLGSSTSNQIIPPFPLSTLMSKLKILYFDVSLSSNSINAFENSIEKLEISISDLLSAPHSNKFKVFYFSLSSELASLNNLLLSNIHLKKLNFLPFVLQIIKSKETLANWKLEVSFLSEDANLTNKDSLGTPSTHSNSLDFTSNSENISSSLHSLSSIRLSVPKTSSEFIPSLKTEEKKPINVFSKDWILNSMMSILHKNSDPAKSPQQFNNIEKNNSIFSFLDNWLHQLIVKSLIYFEGNILSLHFYCSLVSNPLLPCPNGLFSKKNPNHSIFNTGSLRISSFQKNLNLIWNHFPSNYNYLSLLDQTSFLIGAEYIALIYEPPQDSKFSPTGHNFFDCPLDDPQFKVARTAILSFYINNSLVPLTDSTISSTENLPATRSSFTSIHLNSDKKLSFLGKNTSIPNNSENHASLLNPEPNFDNHSLDFINLSLSKKSLPSTHSLNPPTTRSSQNFSAFKNLSSFRLTKTSDDSRKKSLSSANLINSSIDPNSIPVSNADYISQVPKNEYFIKGRINQYSSELVPKLHTSKTSESKSESIVDKFRMSYLPDIVGAMLELNDELENDFTSYYTGAYSNTTYSQHDENLPQKQNILKTNVSTTLPHESLTDEVISQPSDTKESSNISLYGMYSLQPHLRNKSQLSVSSLNTNIEKSTVINSPLLTQPISPKILQSKPPKKIDQNQNFFTSPIKKKPFIPTKSRNLEHPSPSTIANKPTNHTSPYNWLGLSSYFNRKNNSPLSTKANSSKPPAESVSNSSSSYHTTVDDRPFIHFKAPNNKTYLFAKIEHSSFTLVAVANYNTSLSNSKHWFRLVDFVRGQS